LTRRERARRVVDPLTDFLHDETAGGIAIAVATIAALVWANTSADGYAATWERALRVGIDGVALDLDLRHWVNDALMAVFFFVVGLEIKRELVCGELQDRRAATLPVLAALGGVVLPALVFVAVTAGTPEASGWAIPAATDIAFAVGVLALLGDRVPTGAKLFLLTIAIVDDIAAILIIAIFYAGELSPLWLAGAVCGLAAVVALRRLRVVRIAPYVVLGSAIWLAVHESGVHATIAGVALGLLTPSGVIGGRNVLETLEHRLHTVSAFAIVPLFGLANAGVSLGNGVLGDAATSRVAWAIAAGLVLGKLLGIAGATFLGLRLRWGTLPTGMRRGQVWGIAAIGGIGFTVSLFIAQLAYDDPSTVNLAKVGIFAGSLLSGLLGALLLIALERRGARPRAPTA
jgi:NhaA family Na+:H+ antiporter